VKFGLRLVRVLEAMMKPPPTFAGLEGLLAHGQRDGFDIRPTLLRVLTDLYLQKPTHPVEDERYYTELALRLIDSADVEARIAIAARLALYAAAPRAVIMRLAHDPIEIAAPILKFSSCLTPADLEAIAADCGPAHAAVIAARAQPDAKRPDVRGREEAIPAADPAPGVDREAEELTEIFFASSAMERRLILLNLDYAAPASIDLPQANAAVQRLEAAALQHKMDSFAHEIESALSVSGALARRIVADAGGEPVVVAAKALRAPRAVLERILLCANPRIGQSVQRVYDLVTRYEEISTQAALRLVAIWQCAHPRERARQRSPLLPRRAPFDLARPTSAAVNHRLGERSSNVAMDRRGSGTAY
jgi:hypothetical protein